MSRLGEGRPGRILLIEDNPADARIIEEAINEAGITTELTILYHGGEVKDFLGRQGRFTRAARPDLILLDLNLPGKDGREILEELKNDAQWRRIPIIVLTTSSSEQDVLDAYQMHANCYVAKPLSYELMLETMKKIGEFWFRVVRLPAS